MGLLAKENKMATKKKEESKGICILDLDKVVLIEGEEYPYGQVQAIDRETGKRVTIDEGIVLDRRLLLQIPIARGKADEKETEADCVRLGKLYNYLNDESNKAVELTPRTAQLLERRGMQVWGDLQYYELMELINPKLCNETVF